MKIRLSLIFVIKNGGMILKKEPHRQIFLLILIFQINHLIKNSQLDLEMCI